MNVCSLEDDDYEGLFITQSDNSSSGSSNNLSILGDGTDISSPCVSLIPPKQKADECHYSDISDDDFEIPSSQIPHKDVE